jgi:gluconate 2-dehydrogenase gamma chain
MSKDQPSGRRRFLKSAAAVGAVGLSGTAQAQEAHSHKPFADAALPAGERIELAQASAPKPLASQLQAYTYFNSGESDFVEAAVSRLIPNDDLGAGAKEAGVAFFIDQQLAGSYGTLGRGYRLGPSPEGTPQQGYQGPLTPQEIYRVAIRDADNHCHKTFGKRFAELSTAQQDEVLTALEAGKITLEQVPAQRFFALLWNNTQEGFFADPMYGGNRDKVGWKLIGFPGVAAVYTEHIDKHGVPYRAQPVGIADIQQSLARTDEHGHPVHIMISRKD